MYKGNLKKLTNTLANVEDIMSKAMKNKENIQEGLAGYDNDIISFINEITNNKEILEREDLDEFNVIDELFDINNNEVIFKDLDLLRYKE